MFTHKHTDSVCVCVCMRALYKDGQAYLHHDGVYLAAAFNNVIVLDHIGADLLTFALRSAPAQPFLQ